eukprot:TRINITY_DN2360_c0_g1_i1.p1 TRINITY_DN2360_c0_g1~~TRINITY_DN2360_c0_g1_i1.p1  ORF type:complete len:71 (+),score=14.04 TRINITY_DN2360_c0_g1_i1:247-459(+)
MIGGSRIEWFDRQTVDECEFLEWKSAKFKKPDYKDAPPLYFTASNWESVVFRPWTPQEHDVGLIQVTLEA